ncbi:hypothetical protein ACH4TV_33350 [Streptomyces sp. NPDC020898]|uniref:hypothetical protein n=1 Tax=Streptomyces sp. NPDC020898 TaxID=3365101 RepID=UPI0037AC4CBB
MIVSVGREVFCGELTARAELYEAEKITGILTGEDQSGSPRPPVTPPRRSHCTSRRTPRPD